MGEQFLNFHLHQDLQQFCGIDVRPLFHPSRRATYWLQPPAPRLASDLHCLAQLFSPLTPPTRLIRFTSRLAAIYGFVDASSAGFGGSFQLPNGTLFFRHGLWGRDMDSVSYNFRELCNLVDSIAEEVQSGEQANSELIPQWKGVTTRATLITIGCLRRCCS